MTRPENEPAAVRRALPPEPGSQPVPRDTSGTTDPKNPSPSGSGTQPDLPGDTPMASPT